jgi:hypothetical protein
MVPTRFAIRRVELKGEMDDVGGTRQDRDPEALYGCAAGSREEIVGWLEETQWWVRVTALRRGGS